MSKSKKNNGSDISATKIHEILKSHDFLQDLWWDLISDIKEKPTYKRMKEMIEKLITKQINVINSDPKSDSEISRRKAIIAEICSMAYTVDTVFSTILYTRLQNRFPSIIDEIVKEVKNDIKEKTASTSVSVQNSKETKSNSQIATPVTNKNVSAGVNLKTDSDNLDKSIPIKRGRKPKFLNIGNGNALVKVENLETDDSPVKNGILNEKLEKGDKVTPDTNKNSGTSGNAKIDSDAVNKSAFSKRGRKLKPANTESYSSVSIADKNIKTNASRFKNEAVNEKLENSDKAMLSENKINKSPNTSTVKQNLPRRGRKDQNSEKRNSELFEDRNTELLDKEKNSKTYVSKNKKEAVQSKKIENAELSTELNSDAESEISETFSMTSVSSVHTSELSSYEDQISLSDNEGNSKKRKSISVTEAKEMLFNKMLSVEAVEAPKKTASNMTTSNPDDSANATQRNGITIEIVEWQKKKDIKSVDKKEETKVNGIAKEVKTYPKQKVMTDDDDDDSETKSAKVESPQSPAKTLPPRIRKPNSKYVSSSIICPLTVLQQKRKQNEKNVDSESESPQKKKKIKNEGSNENTENKSPKKSRNISVDKDVQNNLKTPVKQQNLKDSFKTPVTVHHLTTRKTAPITLFSTAPQKKS